MAHLPNPEASQDTELVVKPSWSQGDSGYAPKSQESFSHSQPKSLEAYSTSQDELSLQEGGTITGGAEFPKEFSGVLPNVQVEGTKRSPEKKGEGANFRGSQRGGFDYGSPSTRKRSDSGSYSRIQRGNNGNFMMSPARSGGNRTGDFGGYQPGFDMGGRGGRDHYGGYHGGMRDHRDIYGNSSYGDHDGYMRGGHPHGDYERTYPHPDWRRSYTGGDFDHPSPYRGPGMYPDFHTPPMHMRGHFDQGMDRGGRFGTRRNRIMEEARMSRAKSHERVDHLGGPRGAFRPDEEFREPPVDFYLSQPTNPHFPFERPGIGMPPVQPFHMHPGGYDHRQAMGGPSGYSLSQPAAYMGPRSLHGYHQNYERVRLVPLQERERGSQRLRSALAEDRRDRAFSLDEDYEDDEDLDRKDHRGSQGLNHFKRDFRKSIFRDGAVYSNWMDRVHEYGIEGDDDVNTVPLFEGDISQSQRTPSPHPELKLRGDEESEEDEEYDNVHIIELHKGEEPLGIHLTHYTAPDGTDLGVFIGAMNENGFAAKSEKLKINDRILACNGVDFTKEPYKNQVQELFLDMVSKEPLLRMAVSRGQNLSLDNLRDEMDGREEGGSEEVTDHPIPPQPPTPTESSEATRRREGGSESISDAAAVASSNVTNTRQIGVKHTIQITRGSSGYGFGITSRDVTTDDKSTPIYVKSISHGGAAFQDGRLRLGDRILEVDGRGVEGLAQPEVVQLLRQSQGSVTLVVSRQEVVEKNDEEEFPTTPSHSTAPPVNEPTTVGKTVLNLEIPLNNSGPAGLGVTVIGRSGSRKQGDMGIFIKSVVPGGAASLDGRLCRGDQLLCINSQSLHGKSNPDALDMLRKTLAMATGSAGATADSGSKIKLVVARMKGINKKQPGMAALEESPGEVTGEDDDDRGAEPTSHEVGIDVGAEALASQTSQSGGTIQTDGPSRPRVSQTDGPSRPRVSQTDGPSGPRLSQTDGPGQMSQTSTIGVSLSSELEGASQSSTDIEPRRGILRTPGHSPKGSTHSHKSNTLPHSSPGTKRLSPSLTRRTQMATNTTSQPTSPQSNKTYLPMKRSSPRTSKKLTSASGNVMGSGEFDRLEPRLDAVSDVSGPGYGDGMMGPSVPQFGPAPWSPMDGGEWGRMARTPSLNSDLSSIASSQYTRFPGPGPGYMYAPHPHLAPTYPHYPHYPPDAMATGHPYPMPSRLHNGTYDPQFTDSYRLNEMGYPHGYDTSRQNSHTNELVSSSYPTDVMSNVSYTAINLSRDMQAPTRGSNRKERQRSEVSLRAIEAGSSSEQSDIYNHNSRSTSHTQSATPPPLLPVTDGDDDGEGSLDDLRLSDSEISSFRRDDKGRISITKKTKKNPRQDLAHLTLSNPVPLLEGEAGLYRTGSDSCLPEAVERSEPDLLERLEVGPNLGMAKSSSLESLHNIVAHTIKRDSGVIKGDGVMGGRRQAVVNHSLTQPVPTHRPVQIPTFPADLRTRENAVISHTKNPAKKPQKRSIFKKVFKKKKSNKHKSKNKTEATVHEYDTQSVDMEFEEGDDRESSRRTKPSPDGYDSSDEVLATIAKV